MPRAAATSPTASKARSSDTISSTSPGRAAANHTPALTAIRRSLQSFTPEEGALWTSWAPWRASRRAVSVPITRQFPTATNSVRPPRGSIARCSITRAMCAGWLAFSTSKKIPPRLVGSGGPGARGRPRAAKPAPCALLSGPAADHRRRVPVAHLAPVLAQRADLEIEHAGDVHESVGPLRAVHPHLPHVVRLEPLVEQLGEDEARPGRGKDRVEDHVGRHAVVGMVEV